LGRKQFKRVKPKEIGHYWANGLNERKNNHQNVHMFENLVGWKPQSKVMNE
jgi:hypothetical protein